MLSLINPLTPKVEGITLDTHCHISGIALCGHETPDIKRNGTEVNTATSIISSLRFTKWAIMLAKNIQDSKYGNIKHNKSIACNIETKWKRRGTTSNT